MVRIYCQECINFKYDDDIGSFIFFTLEVVNERGIKRKIYIRSLNWHGNTD